MSAQGLGTRRGRRALALLLLLLLVGGGTVFVVAKFMSPDGESRDTGVASDSAPGGDERTSGRDARPTASDAARVPAPAKPPSARRPRNRGAPVGDAAPEAVTAQTPAPLPAAPSPPPSPYGRFTLVGDADAQPGRGFGEGVALDGDLAVIGAPRFKRDVVACGAAWVFERRDGVWTQTQRLDSPRPDRPWFARRVGVASGRVVVFGGDAVGENVNVFRSYSRGADGVWTATQEVRLPEFQTWDAVARGDTVAIAVRGAVLVWKFQRDEWTFAQRIEAPQDGRSPKRFGVWLSLSGPALAVHSDMTTEGSRSVATYVYDATDAAGTFGNVPVAKLVLEGDGSSFGTLTRNGTALCWTGENRRLTFDERAEPSWTRITAPSLRSGSFAPLHGAHGMAADGTLVVAVEVEPAAFAVLERRDDGWYRAGLAAAKVPRDVGEALWHPNVAMSGRTVLAGTGWDPNGSGRAWFFDITDADLAAARRIEPDAK